MIIKMALGLVALTAMTGTAIAHPSDTARPAMQRASMLVGLEDVAQRNPADGGVLIELANAYTLAGRSGDAAVAYRRALTLDNVMLETRSGDAIWSHQVARHMLGTAPQLAAR